jgi:hypothetical protein
MEAAGFRMDENETWPWPQYLKKFVRQWNRRNVKMYGVTPILLMTFAPAEAPDHQSLSPHEVDRLNEYCANQQVKYAHNSEVEVATVQFKKGDVVLVHKVAKRSHKDVAGKGAKSYPGRAVVVRPSTTNPLTHYKIRWLTDGFVDKEKYGDLSRRMWLGWRLKKCLQDPNEYTESDKGIIEAALVEGQEEEAHNDTDLDLGGANFTTDAQDIEDKATKYVMIFVC